MSTIYISHIDTYDVVDVPEIMVCGYSGCEICGEYDKRYSLIDKMGVDLTHGTYIPRSVRETCVIICDHCSDLMNKFEYKFRIDENKRPFEYISHVIGRHIIQIIAEYIVEPQYELCAVKREYEFYKWGDSVRHSSEEIEDMMKRIVSFVETHRGVNRDSLRSTYSEYGK